ncbi:MAG: phosphotransferase [Gammaproteobacteria bacterium]|nr:phosphotransferase [Gammaproteobacteria bacterium]
MTNDIRLQKLRVWLAQQLNSDQFDLSVASADASFRRYFRITDNNKSMIAMDAPPDKEDCRPFITIAKQLCLGGIHAPEVIAEDLSQGFLLLSDLGDTQYLSVLDENNAKDLYKDAIDTLIQIQSVPARELPAYDKALLEKEMQLFPEWFISKHLQISLNQKQQQLLDAVYDCLTENALQQPNVFVHRDYHSRNLMQTATSNPGVLDFQDAVNGAVTYDLASLLKDCYISWPRPQLEQWVAYYLKQAQQKNIIDKHVTLETVLQWFDLIAVQRHLKVLGIFSRLNIRDNKPEYMNDLPRTFQYIIDTCNRYPLLYPLTLLLQELKIAEKLNLEWPEAL